MPFKVIVSRIPTLPLPLLQTINIISSVDSVGGLVGGHFEEELAGEFVALLDVVAGAAADDVVVAGNEGIAHEFGKFVGYRGLAHIGDFTILFVEREG